MSSAAHAARRAISERSIRVLVSPTPITFAERRSVLQVLEQHGPVEVFKMTPGYHSNFISVTKEPTTAATLIGCSPLTFRIAASRKVPNVNVADLDDIETLNCFNGEQPSSTHSQTEQPMSDRHSPRTTEASQDHREFKLEIFPAPEYKHKFAMSGSPLHQPWPEAYQEDKSYMAATLKQSLPQTIPSKGLAHWLFDVGNSTTSKSDRKAERLQLKNWLPSKMKD